MFLSHSRAFEMCSLIELFESVKLSKSCQVVLYAVRFIINIIIKHNLSLCVFCRPNNYDVDKLHLFLYKHSYILSTISIAHI